MVKMKQLFFCLIVFTSCYTETQKPDYKFMKLVHQQAGLDSSLKTTIELIPKKYFFGEKKNLKILKGTFQIKNTGDKPFKIISIESNCNCIITSYNRKEIAAGDSIEVAFLLDLKYSKGLIRNSIIAIGNCQFGNQTFYIEGTIF